LRFTATLTTGLLLLGACTRATPAPSASPEAGREHADVAPPSSTPRVAPAPAAPSEPAVHRAERNLMGTIWALTLIGGTAEQADRAAKAALDEVARLEALLSEWQPDSEISRVNRAAGVVERAAAPRTYRPRERA
jgi:thiamine biosynthesis lipoprotein